MVLRWIQQLVLRRKSDTSLQIPAGSGIDGSGPHGDVIDPPGGIVSSLDIIEFKEHVVI
jgi:hypothetical protein